MSTFPIFLQVVLFCLYLQPALAGTPSLSHSSASSSSDNEFVFCYTEEYDPLNGFARPHTTDCDTAINMIPSGEFLPDFNQAADLRPGGPHPDRPIPLELPPHSRHRKFFMPAIFRSGTCMVSVRPASPRYIPGVPPRDSPLQSRPQITNAASAMYSVVWPNVRQNAARIMAECFARPASIGGGIDTKSKIGSGRAAWFYYEVELGYVPERGFPGDGWRYLKSLGPLSHADQDKHLEIEYNVYEAGGTASGHCTKGIWGTRTQGGVRPVYHGSFPWLFS